MKRLFLFAGYDVDGVVGPSLIYYVSALSGYGDVIVVMDNDSSPEEMRKLSGLVLHAEAGRHGEYDFGSYKRAFMWAEAALRLEDYDVCYLVNDSVFGPFRELGEYFAGMESGGKDRADAFSMAFNPHRQSPHMQSWFMGFRKNVFAADWFRDFLHGVSRQPSKEMVCSLYETGLSALLGLHGCRMYSLYKVKGRRIYNDVRKLYRKGMPFVKKSAFTRHAGSLGAQVRYVLDHADHDVRKAVMEDACRLWGMEYVSTFLTYDPFRIFSRTAAYVIGKFLNLRKKRITGAGE